MNFTDIFIRRPVLASVVSLAVLVVGLRSFGSLQVLAYPKTENGVVTISTAYPGADPDSIAGFITTPIENAVAQANGIDYMTSISQSGTSTISVNLRQNYDTSRAASEINIKVNSILNQLPSGALQPTITVAVGQTIDAMFIGFRSSVLAANQVTDYLTRVVIPKIQAVQGVQTAEMIGGQIFSLRAWLDPQKLAAYGLTASDVSAVLAANDYISAVGNTKGQMVQVTLTSTSNLHSLNEFRDLVVKQVDGGIVRLSDVATVSLGADSYESQVRFDGQTGVFIGIQVAPTANLLTVIRGVKAAMPEIRSQLPQGLTATIAYDSTTFVNSSIHEVAYTLIEALVIVMCVIFAFLGSPRSVLIPVVAIPLSLVGTLAIMLALGFSINLLTLLALVLAIGLVVDDAIIVVENVNRHLEGGTPPMAAASLAARELANPIIAMTVVLLAVYIPIGFQGGLTGALFTEFAFTLAGAVTVSAVIALTLSPMMCSRLLHAHRAQEPNWETRVVKFIDSRLQRLHDGYQRLLIRTLRYRAVTAVFVLVILVSILLLYRSSRSELAPQEDQGFVLSQATYAPDATLQRKLMYGDQAYAVAKQVPGKSAVFQIDAPGQSFMGVSLVPRDQRKLGANEVQRDLQVKLNALPAQKFAVFQLPSLPGAFGLPVQFAIKTTEPPLRLNEVSRSFLNTVAQSGLFMFIDSDLKYDAPQSVIEIDRDKAAQIGLTMSQVGSALTSLLGGGYVNYFSMQTRSYKVIPQVERVSRLNAEQVLNYPIASLGGVPIPLSTIATIRQETVPETLNHFQQLNAATLSGVTAAGVSQAEALKYLQDLAAKTLPQGYSVDYGGQARQYLQESGGVMATFGFAIIIVFLALAALFESFRDPLVILISVPLSIAGALIFIAIGIGGASLNIYTQVGLVTLIGLISKHGILIVEVANEEQHSGKSKAAAIVTAAGVRLRPILMTTAAMVLGVLPLVFASGAGAASRFAIGLVISTGLAIGTLFTLFVVPGVYMLIGADHSVNAASEPLGAAESQT
ncbi:MAG TPA: efflux RND transporter permease subunit [Steroidobacteraceae bacterium]|nr:efflux RND transporter permease subunit [Steroidobacteraceae bacterium]